MANSKSKVCIAPALTVSTQAFYTQTNKENSHMALNLKKRDLSKYDIEVHVDISGSMDGQDTGTPGETRLNNARKTVEFLVREAEKIDTDGPTVGFFNDGTKVFENTTFDKVAGAFAQVYPHNGTDTAKAVGDRINAYFERRFGKPGGWLSKGTPANPNCKPVILVMITDGIPSDQGALERVIVEATKRLTKEGLGREALGISFIQVGNDASAKRFLETLNNGLTAKGATMDIVNCITIDEVRSLGNTQAVLEKALDD